MLRVDSFGDHGDVECMSHVHDRADERDFFVIGVDAVDEGAVDLEHVDVEFADIGEARVAGTEVVDCESEASVVECCEVLPD